MLSVMKKRQQQRRSGRSRQQDRRAPGGRGADPGRPAGSPFVRTPPPDHTRQDEAGRAIDRLIRVVGAVSGASTAYAVELELARHDSATVALMDELLTSWLRMLIGMAWERGWLPLDLLHIARRSSPRHASLLAAVTGWEAADRRADERAPVEWRNQFAVVADEAVGLGLATPVAALATALHQRGLSSLDAWADVAGLAAALNRLGTLQPILPPPSAWGQQPPPPRAPRASSSSGGGDRDRVLNKIRGLLAKAEATDYAAEAEVFTAKAQELITRHAIDEALLHAAEPTVTVLARRVHLSNPYAGTKVLLLSAVGRANRSKVVYLEDHAIATVVGTPADVDHVELLFASLLVQATRAMAEAGTGPAGSHARSASFRKSFLAAYAHRIGERLVEVDDEQAATYGRELVPVLRRQAEAVEGEFDRLFPQTFRSGGGLLDGRGWAAGQLAADRAVFVSGRLTA